MTSGKSKTHVLASETVEGGLESQRTNLNMSLVSYIVTSLTESSEGDISCIRSIFSLGHFISIFFFNGLKSVPS